MPQAPTALLTMALLLAVAGCAASSAPPIQSEEARYRAATSEVRVIGVENDVPASDASGDLRLVATPTPSATEVTVAFVDASDHAIELETRDGTPILGIEAFDVELNDWVSAWTLDRSTCGNAQWPVELQPNRALRVTLRSTSHATPARVRFVAGALRSNEVSLPLDPLLIQVGSVLARRRSQAH